MKFSRKIFKPFTAGFIAFTLLLSVSLGACKSNKNDAGNTDKTEAAGDHPSAAAEGSEHPGEGGGEHPKADSTATKSEHPTDSKEHPTDK